MSRTPIVIFAFNRPDALRRLIASLRANPGYESHPIRVYVDGPRGDHDRTRIAEVISEARTLTPDVVASPVNKGLAGSIIAGVSEVITQAGAAIVLEDDLVLMPGFLQYMEDALTAYRCDSRIFSVCGYGLRIDTPSDLNSPVYLSDRSSSWGWATWRDRWESVDWDVSDWDTLRRSPLLRRAFNRGGSDMFGMLRGYMEGHNRSWAIRFCYSQHRQGRFSVHPVRSLVDNEGYGADATNCRQKYSRFKTDPDLSGAPIGPLPSNLCPDPRIMAQLHAYHSLSRRIYSKIRKILNI